jgi:hypothetical protein
VSRNIQLAALAAILIGTAAAWWILRSPDGFLTGIAPVDGTRSVFTMRANYDDGPSRAWIGLIDAEQDDVVWWRELPGETYSLSARHGLTVSEKQVTVKVQDTEDTARVLAFDLATGEERWQGDAIELQPSEPPMPLSFVTGDRPYDDGRQVFHGDHDRAAASLVARDAATGATQWSHELPGHGVHDILFSPNAVLIRRETWKILDRSRGAVMHELDVSGDGCIDDEGRFVTWHDDTLFRIDLADLAAPPQRQPLPSEGTVKACGTHAGRLVFTVAGRWDELEDRSFAMIAVSGDAPVVDWRLDLGPWEPSSSAHNRDNADFDAAPNRGRLADFVPLVLSAHEVDELRLVVVDMANGALAWESEPQADLLFYQLYRGSGSQHFLGNGSRIVALDGGSGQVTAAVDVVHQTSLSLHAAEGRLWIYSMDWQRMNDLPWAVLDGLTLAVVARGNAELQPVDTTAETIAWLGGGG